MEDIILEINQLSKAYKDVKALNGLSINVKRGQVFGLLGPNGSGKTTTLGILLGVLQADSGSFNWFGNGQVDANRKRIGALLETPNFYPYLSAVDNLKVVAKIKDMKDFDARIDTVLERVNLFERRNSKFKTYSLGMKQRLAIASAMLSDPEVLVLDEPTNGLDPEGIAEIRDLIREIAAEGKTIVIASHILDEVEKVCTHVAIMRKGQLLQIGTLQEIMTQDRLIKLKAPDLALLKQALSDMKDVKFVGEEDGELIVSADQQTDASQLNKMMSERGIFLSGLREHRKSLETTFLEIVKQ